VTSSSIRAHVTRILRDLGIDQPPIDVDAVAQALHAEIRREPFADDLSGVLMRKDHRAVIGVNQAHLPERQRFTIAHELGHLELHKGTPVHFDRAVVHVNLRNSISSQAVDREEIEANRFAAELLMPEAFLRRDVDELRANGIADVMDDGLIQELARRYTVSLQAMTFRLANLGLAGVL
jgi:Zn-dependent peptidase ImmA (M78 family)